MGLLFREHPKAQPEGGFRRSPGSNLRPLVYKASDFTTAPRRLLIGWFLLLKRRIKIQLIDKNCSGISMNAIELQLYMC